MSHIHFVLMPFSPVEWPSIGIGVLVSATQEAGFDTKADYFSIRFATRIGVPLYSFCMKMLFAESLFGEWVFSNAAFEGFQIPYEQYPVDAIMENEIFQKLADEAPEGDKAFQKKFKDLPGIAKEFTEASAQELVMQEPKIVGCSTNFQQYTASLALLRRLKELDPGIVTLLGGANCEAELGYITVKNFPWVDFVVSGEADSLIPRLCRQILEQGPDIPVEEIPYGVYSAQKLPKDNALSPGLLRQRAETHIEKDLDSVPVPNYDDYFEEVKRTGLDRDVTPNLMIEMSRGCWKGYKQPCNFCGLNGFRCQYRKKSPERVLRELSLLSKTYGIYQFKTSDCILNMGYFGTLFKELAEQKAPYKLYFETRSSLDEHQVKMLADAGVVWIQPGIESLNDELLKLLNKGTSAIHNIALLKYGLEQNIFTFWSILHDIPGDQDRFYREMVDFLPLLYHLPPPNLVKIRFDRFSEYFEKAPQFDLHLVPNPTYKYVYPFDDLDLETFTCFFNNENADFNAPIAGASFRALKRQVLLHWRPLFLGFMDVPPPELVMSETGRETVIHDTRPCAVAPEFILTGIERSVYRSCRVPMNRAGIYNWLHHENSNDRVGMQDIDRSLGNLIEKKLLLFIKGKFLALATYQPRGNGNWIRQANDLDRMLQEKIKRERALKPSLQSNLVWDWFATLSE